MDTLIIFKIIIIVLAILCAVSDARRLIIPNKLILGMVGLFPIAFALNYSSMPIDGHLIAGALAFGISMSLYGLKLMGGGDSKMVGALGLWLGLKALIPFVVVMAMTGGLLAAIALILKQNKHLIPKSVSPDSWFGQLNQDKSVVPYGIAIAIGGAFGLL